MASHYWRDESFDWRGLSKACGFIGENLRKWGRVDVTQWKEKYGECRVYCRIGISMFHQIIWPGYCYNQYPYKFLWVLDCKYFRFISPVINLIAIPYHKWLYRKLYAKAVKDYPHLHDEILDAADFDELLEGL